MHPHFFLSLKFIEDKQSKDYPNKRKFGCTNIHHNDSQHSDTQHSDTQHSDTQHSDTQHSDTQHNDTP